MKFDIQKKLHTLQEKTIAATPRGRQQHKALKMDHAR